MDKQVELLSPAGSWDALVAAVQNGADAIYMGGTKFSARRMADNFDNDKLKEAIDYAHLYGVKIYITINILIKEKELDDLRSFLPLLEEYSVDGVIIQDLGAIRIIAQEYPKLSLHASTQMTVHQLEGVQVLENMGFSRVVPARELTLEEIRHITQNSQVKVETFIHGALCVSYSGQCLMSSILGGRSGNRGMCAQPCRLPYTLNKGEANGKGKPKYQISMKDLSSIDFLDDIIAAGVTSFKIEGRMKRAEYVAVVTREYRKALDIMLKDGHYLPNKTVDKELQQIFNRGGFTKGYYYGTDHRNLFAQKKPNHWGIYLGKVTGTDKNIVWIELDDDIEVGDGIEYWVEEGSSKGQTVSSLIINGRNIEKGVKGQVVGIKSSIRIESGTYVYRTSKASQLKLAESSYSNIYKRKIPVKAVAELKMDGKPALTLWDQEGNQGRTTLEYQIQPAIKRALNEDEITIQLNKLGDTPFIIESLTVNMDEGIFLPVSVLNQLRREAVQDLIGNRVGYYHERAIKISDRNISVANLPPIYQSIENPQLCGYLDRLDIEPSVLEGLDVLSYAPRTFSFKLYELKEQVSNIQKMRISVHLVLPRITRMDDMTLLRSLPDEIWTIFDDYQIGNLGQIKLLTEKGIQKCYGDYGLNVMNTLSIAQLYDLGLKGIVLSPELTIGEIRDIIKKSSLPCEILVYGRVTLMTMEYCPHAMEKKGCSSCRSMSESSLTDRMGYEFPLVKRRISHCYTELLNSQSIFLADDMNAIHRVSAAGWGLKLEGLTEKEMQSVLALYRFALDHPGKGLPETLSTKAEEIKKNGFTKGHFFRGVE